MYVCFFSNSWTHLALGIYPTQQNNIEGYNCLTRNSLMSVKHRSYVKLQSIVHDREILKQ